MKSIINKIVAYSCAKGFFNWLPDKPFLELYYWGCFGKKLNLNNPKTFNEKLQWLKLYDRKPIYTTMVDKYEVKKYVSERIGEQYIIPTIGIWNRFEDIDFSSLPNQFVLKCTHDSGGIVICRDKTTFDYNSAKKTIEKSLKRNFYYQTREWPYKNVEPRILAEKYMEDESTGELRDYKIFTFDGVAKVLFVASDRQNPNEETKFDFYDIDFKHLDIINGHPNAKQKISKPNTLEKMIELANQLSTGIPQLRVDFYEVNGKTYFGELTFAHWGGMMPFKPEKWDETFGKWIKLPEENGGGYCLIDDDFVLWLHPSTYKEMIDYKFYCFEGKPQFLYVSEGLENHSTAKISFLNLDWTFAPFQRSDYKRHEVLPSKPFCYQEMLDIAELLSKGHVFLRVDLYEINKRVYFSETTFSPCGGVMEFNPTVWDNKIGKMILLPEK